MQVEDEFAPEPTMAASTGFSSKLADPLEEGVL